MTSGREEVATLLYSLQDSIASLARRIDDGLRHLPDVKSDDLERFLSEYRHLFVVWHKEQLEDWDAFVASNVLQVIRRNFQTLCTIHSKYLLAIYYI